VVGARDSNQRDQRPAVSTAAVEAARLEVLDAGSGEPVVFIQTALTADELFPVADRLRDRFRTIVYRRRGYGESTPAAGPGSIALDAADCCTLLEVLRTPQAHVVGFSYSGAVAMQLAADAPDRVHSLTLVEPPPVHVPSAPEFRAANEQLFAARRARGLDAALEEFLTQVIGPHWHADMERLLPGSVEQMRRDSRTFFDVDMPALLTWRFSAEDANRIKCPVLHVGGTDSGPWFAEVRRLILDWFPDAEDVVVDGADHSLAITHTAQVAAALNSFMRRHRMSSTGEPSR
jgi:pimeloyl-ACP methyl ester carboxylesterase